MSRERELLNALKESVANDPYATGGEGSKEAAEAAPAAADSAANTAAEFDMNSLLDFFNTMGTSMIDDPLFYLKITGLIIIAVIILVVAFEMIIGS